MYDATLIEAIDRIIANTPEKLSKNAELIDVLMRCKVALTDVPKDMKQDRAKGRWIVTTAKYARMRTVICSKCKDSFNIEYSRGHYYNLCPTCGADMREEKDGES